MPPFRKGGLGGISFAGMALVSAQPLLSESPPMWAPPFRVGTSTKALPASGGMLYCARQRHFL
jgi:hypothetical protein